MSTNPQFATQYHTQTTPETPDSQTTPSGSTRIGQTETTPASATAPRTFEPTSTGEMPPMFDPEADKTQR